MASSIGKAIGYGEAPGGPPSLMGDVDEMDSEAGPDSAETPAPAGAETLAMKQFERATTTEAKVQAMKDFLESLGVC